MKQEHFYGLDLLKFTMALLVALRHLSQMVFDTEGPWGTYVGHFLSNLAVPVFFILAGFFLFRKIVGRPEAEGRAAFHRYRLHVLKLAFLWNLIYFPVDWPVYLNWGYPDQKTMILDFIRYFLLSGNTVHLWYLMALVFGISFVEGYRRMGLKTGQILLWTGLLFIIGCIGDNFYYNRQLPPAIYEIFHTYYVYFLTFRNGFFYGSF